MFWLDRFGVKRYCYEKKKKLAEKITKARKKKMKVKKSYNIQFRGTKIDLEKGKNTNIKYAQGTNERED